LKIVVYICSLVVALLCIALIFEFGARQLLPDSYRGYLIEEEGGNAKWAFGPFEPSQKATGFNTPIIISKPNDTIRIVSVGASGTEGWLSAKAVFKKYGQEWEPNSLSSYSRATEFILNDISGESSDKIEVINLGVAAYNATDIIRMLKDSMQFEPDIFLIHIGINETWTSERTKWSAYINDDIPYLYSELGYEVFTEMKAGWRTLDIGKNAFSPLALIKSRPRPIVLEPPGRAAGLDERLENYRGELQRLGDFLKSKKIPALFLVPAQNIADFQPFGSMAKAGTDEQQLDRLNELLVAALAEPFPEAKERYQEILALDDGIAEANFQLARIYAQENNAAKALEYFWKANDRDIVLKRPPHNFHDATVEFAELNGFPYVDVLGFLAGKSAGGSVGNEWIYDDVHPRRNAQFDLGAEIAKQIVGQNLLQPLNYSGDVQNIPEPADYDDWTGLDQRAVGSIAYLRAAHNFWAFGRFRQRMNWDPEPEQFLGPVLGFLDTANEYAPSDQSLFLSAALNLFVGRKEAAEQDIAEMGCSSSPERAELVYIQMSYASQRLFGQSRPALKKEMQGMLVLQGCVK
jgi:hypothetical protein